MQVQLNAYRRKLSNSTSKRHDNYKVPAAKHYSPRLPSPITMSSSQSDDGIPNDRQISRNRFQSRDSLNSNSSSISSGNYPPKASEVSPLATANVGKPKRKLNTVFDDKRLNKSDLKSAKTSNSVKYSNVNGLVKPSCHENSEYKNEPRRQDHYYNYTKFTSKVVPKNVTKFSHDNVPVAVKPRNVAQLESKMAQHSIDYNNAHKGKDKSRRKNISSSSDNQYVSFNVLQKSTPQNKLNINNLVGSKKTISLVESPAFLDQITTQKRAYDRNKIKKDKKRKISATKSEEPLFSDAKNTSSLSSYEEKNSRYFDSYKVENSSLNQSFPKTAEERLKPTTSSSNSNSKFSNYEVMTNNLICSIPKNSPEIKSINTCTEDKYQDLQKPENLKPVGTSNDKINTYLNGMHVPNLHAFTNHLKIEKETQQFNNLSTKHNMNSLYDKSLSSEQKSDSIKEKVEIKVEPEIYDLTGSNEISEPQTLESLEITDQVKCELDQIEVDSGIIAEEKKVDEQASDLEDENKEEVSSHVSVEEPTEVQPTYLEVIERLKEEQIEKEKAKRKLVDEEYQKLLQEYLTKKFVFVYSFHTSMFVLQFTSVKNIIEG